MRVKIMSHLVYGALAISAIAIAPIFSARAAFAQDAPEAAADSTKSAPAESAAAKPTTAQIAPVDGMQVSQPKESRDPFDFAPASQIAVQDLGVEPCGASVSCPVQWRLDEGWAIDTGGPGIFLDLLSEDF